MGELSTDNRVKVWFYTVAHVWHWSSYPADSALFLEWVSLQFKNGNTHAVWFDGTSWCVLCEATGECRQVPSREAAEMLAIHRG